jgi:hypothetical protein
VEASAPASRQAFRSFSFRCDILVLGSAIGIGILALAIENGPGLFALNGINCILNNQQDAW